MSEDALNASIAAKWESAGLDAGADDMEVAREPEVEPATNTDDIPDPDPSEAAADDPPADLDPNAADPDPVEEADPVVPPADPDPAVDHPVEPEAQAEAEDDLATALGLGKPPEDPKKRAAWWKTRVPYSQVHKAVTEQTKKLTEAHTGALKAHTDKIAAYDTRFGEVKTVEDIITGKPEQYIKTLATLMPETYGKLFAPILGGEGTTTPEQLLVDEADPGPQPEADLEIPNGGGKTYSVEGYQKLMAWQQKVTEQNMLKRMKPHMDFLKAQQEAAERKRTDEVAADQKARGLKSANDALAKVRTRDMAEAHIKEIVDYAKGLDESLSAEAALNIAYIEVVLPKMKADRDKMTADILAAQKKASAKQTSATLTQGKPVAAAAATGSVDDRIKAAWKRAGLV